MKVFGLKKGKVIGGWRKLYSEKHYNFLLFTKYYWGDQIKDEMDRKHIVHRDIRNAYKI
jgi:hypothetical protein